LSEINQLIKVNFCRLIDYKFFLSVPALKNINVKNWQHTCGPAINDKPAAPVSRSVGTTETYTSTKNHIL